MNKESHANWFRNRLRDARILEVGGPERWTRRWRARRMAAWMRRIAVPAALTLAMVCTGVGALLAVSPPTPSVTQSWFVYRVGDSSLHAVGAGAYVGDGTLLIRGSVGGQRAASSATVRGVHLVGTCAVTVDGLSESCRFQLGNRTVTAEDVWSQGAWHRHYLDGTTLDITAARGVPVPFPVGY